MLIKISILKVLTDKLPTRLYPKIINKHNVHIYDYLSPKRYFEKNLILVVLCKTFLRSVHVLILYVRWLETGVWGTSASVTGGQCGKLYSIHGALRFARAHHKSLFVCVYKTNFKNRIWKSRPHARPFRFSCLFVCACVSGCVAYVENVLEASGRVYTDRYRHTHLYYIYYLQTLCAREWRGDLLVGVDPLPYGPCTATRERYML